MMRPGGKSSQWLLPWRRGAQAGPFQLTRYFIATSLAAFAVLGGALYALELGEQRFFADVQREQGAFVALMQAQLLQEQAQAARTNLVATHEAGHETLARVFANALWDSHFAPLVAQAGSISIAPCSRPAREVPPTEAAALARLQQECYAELGRQVIARPAFGRIDAPVRDLMHKTAVFKIKVYDLRGLTVYSSETRQIGELKADNTGWRAAVVGRTASELVHRNRFSAFEGEVQDRDLIQSYIPASGAAGGIAGVFEIYSDVTPLLQQLDLATTRAAEASTRNQALVQEAAARNQAKARENSNRLMMIVAALLALVYLALMFLVRNAQRLIDAEAAARAQAAQREQEWHRDKMATMAAMAANISHEVGNPLAIISGLAQEIGHWRESADVAPELPNMIVEQTARIANMTRRISDFARAGRDSPEALDVNESVQALCDFLAFDQRFRGTPIVLHLGERLPACQAIPDHLTEALMGMLRAFEETCEKSCGGASSRIEVTTAASGPEVTIRIGCECPRPRESCALPPDDWRFASARRSVEGMGGRVEVAGNTLEIHLLAAG